MDQTKRPLLIPPEFANYAEKNGIFDMYKVIIARYVRYFEFVSKCNDHVNIKTKFAGGFCSISYSLSLPPFKASSLHTHTYISIYITLSFSLFFVA